MIIRTIFDFQIHVAWLNNYSNLNCTSYASLENILATARTLGVWDLELCQLYQVRYHQWLWSSPRDMECGSLKQVSIVGPLQCNCGIIFHGHIDFYIKGARYLLKLKGWLCKLICRSRDVMWNPLELSYHQISFHGLLRLLTNNQCIIWYQVYHMNMSG